MKKVIKFCRPRDAYGFLSNFSHHSFETEEFSEKRHSIYKLFWRTSEHYFQAMKFVGMNFKYAEKIRCSPNPSEAARLGRDRSIPIRPDWEHVKEIVMEEALMAKFTQNLDIKRKLLETGDAILVEHRKADRYWGDGGNGSGKNRLGILLMKVRYMFQTLDFFDEDNP